MIQLTRYLAVAIPDVFMANTGQQTLKPQATDTNGYLERLDDSRSALDAASAMV
ncbi:hypothetical protein [Stutzerimonas nitrititolerans]|uniref:hypothetical protein n=1 Tax=Stutzerimonas nitrititolerans TaxID=2482751 RepID=UPI0028ADD710|nr:hypothetical protein [Stutzerimonas nitrititolerans]